MVNSLKYFIRRSVVLKQYRQLLKSAKLLGTVREDQSLGVDTMEQIKTRFRVHQQEANAATVAVLIKDGDKHLEMLRHLAGQVPERHQQILADRKHATWKGSKDPDGTDERGRIGQGWPWEQS